MSMEVSQRKQTASPTQFELCPITHISTATAIPSQNNVNPADLPSKIQRSDSVNHQTTIAFSPSTTSLLPTPSPAVSSAATGCQFNSSGDGPGSSLAAQSGSTPCWKSWKWEMGACALVLAVPLIMVATIFPHRDQPIPQWPFRISINALLSIYALVFKSAIAYIVTSCVGQLQWSWFSSGSRPLSDVVLFDGAGRGPWGLLAMLWEHRFQQPLAILAAVIMISGIAIDPFIQQLIRPFDCSVPSDRHIATLPRTNRLDNYFNSGDLAQTSGAQTLRSTLVAGLYSSGNELPYGCSTGNCTFPDTYNTLGLCSVCEDRSADIVVESMRLSDSGDCGTQNITTRLTAGDEDYYWGINEQEMNTTFYDACDVDTHTDVARMDVLSGDELSVRIDVLVGKTKFSDARRLISTAQNITGCDSPQANDTWACRGYGAASCTLRPCVRTYSASVEAGHLREDLISQSAAIDWGRLTQSADSQLGRNISDGPYHGLLDTECVSTQEGAFLTTRGYDLQNTTGWIPFQGDLSQDSSSREEASSDWDSHVESLLRQNCLYLISGYFLYTVGYGNDMGPHVMNPDASDFVGTVQALMSGINQFGDDVYDVFGGPEMLQNIYDYGRVDFERIQSVFQNISDSLTTFMRTHGNLSHSEPAIGQVQHYATCLGIQWAWIGLPAVLAVLTILFLCLVMDSASRREIPVWKASLLPWILNGGSEARGDTSPADSQGWPKGGTCISVARMEDESKQILASMSEGARSRIDMIHVRDHNLQAGGN